MLPAIDHEPSVHDHVLDAHRMPFRIVEGGGILHGDGIEHDDIRSESAL